MTIETRQHRSFTSAPSSSRRDTRGGYSGIAGFIVAAVTCVVFDLAVPPDWKRARGCYVR